MSAGGGLDSTLHKFMANESKVSQEMLLSISDKEWKQVAHMYVHVTLVSTY